MTETINPGTSTEPVTAEVRDGVGVLTLDRPRQRNPLSVATMTAFTTRLRELAASPDVRAVVVRANGPAFSAGHDLREMVGRTLDDEREVFAVCTEMMAAVQEVPQPVIAAVQGTAVAAGCQLVATCDLAVAASSAVFGTPGVRIGLFCSTPMVAVSRAIGRKRALQLLLTGDVIDAATAADWGLINRAVPDDELDAAVDELLGRATRGSAASKALGKRAFYAQVDMDQARAYEYASNVMAAAATTAPAQEGIAAFLAKRPPVFD